MIDGSLISLIYDEGGSSEIDITNHAVITAANFSSAANGTAGECEVHLRDMDRTLNFITGRRLKLRIDGQPMWSGFTMIKGMGSFLPAGDGKTNTQTRKYVLHGIDNNVLWDRRVLYNPANLLKKIPNIITNTYDGVLLKQALASYSDQPAWLDITSQIDNVVFPAGAGYAPGDPAADITPKHPWAWPTQGSKVRLVVDDLARWSAAVYYIGPDDKVHYHAIQNRECPWGFSDRPNHGAISASTGFQGAYWGFREMNAEEDGSQFATDSFVWGGSAFAGSGSTVFHRATDTALEALHGKWQLAEVHFNETNYKLQAGVNQRANMIVYGNPTATAVGSEPGTVVGEGPRGLRFAQWSYSFGWSSKDVPYLGATRRHMYPGDIVPIQLWAFSQDGGTTPFTKFLPLRSLTITFPSGAKNGKAHVEYRGTFDLRNDDSKFLWKYLRAKEAKVTSFSLGGVNDSSTDAPYGGFGQFTPLEAADGSRTVFHVKFAYIADTSQLYVDTGSGLVLKPRGSFYTESDPDTGEFTMASAPSGGTVLYMACRTQAG